MGFQRIFLIYIVMCWNFLQRTFISYKSEKCYFPSCVINKKYKIVIKLFKIFWICASTRNYVGKGILFEVLCSTF